MAQLGSAGALGALGRRFESCRPDHLKPSYTSESPNSLFYFLFVSNIQIALRVALVTNQN